MRNSKLLVIATGAANTVRLPELLMALRSLELDTLNVLLTAAAERIVRRETIGLFCDQTFTETDPKTHFTPGHMGLALQHDQIVVLPASLHTMAACAHGISDRLATQVLLGHPSPCLFFPSMNRHMWRNPATQRNIATLREDGHVVIAPPMQRGYEVASRTMTTNPGLPPAGEILTAIRSHAAATQREHIAKAQ